MRYESLRKIAIRNGISEQIINKIIHDYKVHDSLDRVLLSMISYDENGIEGLASGASAFQEYYERVKNTSSYENYFKKYYEEWICLVLETKDGNIYEYSKRQMVTAFRGLVAHGSSEDLRPKFKYLADFLNGLESPDVLFCDTGKAIHCLPQHMRRRYTEDNNPFIFQKKYMLAMKEAILLGIFAEFFNYKPNDGPYWDAGLLSDTSYLKEKNPNLAQKITEQLDIVTKNMRR